MRSTIITANLGHFDKMIDPVQQSIPIDFTRFTDRNFPPRFNSMTPRLQARIPKMFGWQMVPEYDYYIWVDSSCALLHPDSAKWLLEQCKNVDMAVLKHPDRNSIQEEADYLKKRLSIDCSYITPRYKNELIDEQLEVIKRDKDFVDDKLFASTVIVYKNNSKVRYLMKEWWYHTSRFHSIDQLSFPYVIFKSGCKLNVIQDSYFKTPYISYIRVIK